MDDSKDIAEARIRALGQLRVSAEVHDETDVLTRLIEDPDLRSAAGKASRKGFRAFSRRHRVLVGGLIVLVGVGVTVPAAALTSWFARTGEFGNPSTSTEEDVTEWIDLGAPDAPQVVVDAFPDYLALPKGVPPEAAMTDVARIFAKLDKNAGGQGVAQEGLMTQTYEGFAICAWTEEWLSAHKAADATRKERAATWLGDPANFPSLVAHDGGGVTEMLMNVAADARDGNVIAVERASDMQSCDQRLGGGE